MRIAGEQAKHVVAADAVVQSARQNASVAERREGGVEGDGRTCRGLLQRLDVLVRLLLGQREALGADLHGLGHAEVSVVGEADLGDAALLECPRHLRHAVLRVEGAGAVYVIIR